MRSRLLAAGAVTALLVACGGSDSPQDEVADLFLDEMSDEEIEFDSDCVRDAIGQLSDADAQRILDAEAADEDPDLGPEALAIADDVFGCVDTNALVDQMLDELGDEFGDAVDADCVRDALSGVDLSAIEDGSAFGDLFQCISIGG